MNHRFKQWLIPALFTLVGSAAGLAYYTLFGCTTGCTITSSPLRTMLYFAVVGFLLSQLFPRKKEE